jgi:hypothetical protein
MFPIRAATRPGSLDVDFPGTGIPRFRRQSPDLLLRGYVSARLVARLENQSHAGEQRITGPTGRGVAC